MIKVHSKARQGAFAVEMAMVAPILLLIVFACFEFARMNMVRHTIANASYAACRHVIVPGASKDEAVQRAEQILAVIGIKGAEISFDPAVITENTPSVETKIRVPCSENTWGLSLFFQNGNFESVTMLRTERIPVVQAKSLPNVVNPPPILTSFPNPTSFPIPTSFPNPTSFPSTTTFTNPTAFPNPTSFPSTTTFTIPTSFPNPTSFPSPTTFPNPTSFPGPTTFPSPTPSPSPTPVPAANPNPAPPSSPAPTGPPPVLL